MSFQETIEALAAEEKATALFDERFQESLKEWEEIQARRAVLRDRFSDSDGDALAGVADLVRNYGPKAAKYLGYPGLATAVTAAAMADEGTFIGDSGILSIIVQALGW